MPQVPSYRVMPQPIELGGKWREMNYTYEALLASHGHYRLPNGRWSGGGPFYVVRQSRTTAGTLDYNWKRVGVVAKGKTGGVAPLRGSTAPDFKDFVRSCPSYASQVQSNLPRYATGWARTRPGNPTADLGQFIIELRDLPTLPGRSILRSVPFQRVGHEAKRRLGFFQSLGSEYLNVVFGWKPFVNDLRKIYNLMKDIDRQIAQIRKDNGRGVRRSGTVERSSSTTQEVTNYTFPFANVFNAPPTWVDGRSVHKVTTTTEVNSWFSALYTYYIQDTSDWKWEARARAALFGALPTPSLLWEVMPWSWLIDWFTNVGDIMTNVSANAVDNLVAPYSYIMTHTKTTRTATCETWWTGLHGGGNDINAGSLTASTTYIRETKVRAAGSPYGLGVSYGSLSGHQKAVLAALGLSRSRF